MNLTAIRRLYAYHFALHDQLWASVDHLTDAQFVQDIPYSIGSVRHHMVHLLSVDQRWFARVMAAPLPDRLVYEAYPTKASARADWDAITPRLKASVMNELTDADLMHQITYAVRRPQGTIHHTSPVWEILVHVVNHGTDHRAQLLRLLHDFGAPTFEQDMVIHWWGETSPPAPLSTLGEGESG